MVPLSEKVRATYGEEILGRRKDLSKPMKVVARQAVYAAAGAELGPDAPAGSARLNPRFSKAVNEHNIGYMTIYWIWLQSYLNAT